MDEHTLATLGFPKIREMLASRTSFAVGRELAEAIAPTADAERIREWQRETTEARGLLAARDVSLAGVRDVRGAVKRAALGAVLEPSELLAIADTLCAAARVKRAVSDAGRAGGVLQRHAEAIAAHGELEEAIRLCLNDKGEVTDAASDELRRIRAQIRNVQARIKEKLESTVRSKDLAQFIQEPIVTIRGDRYVVPVKQEHRGQVPGVVHDRSASGATLFVEPLVVVELNNELRQLVLDEREEILRILRRLSRQAGAVADGLSRTLWALGALDFALAKARSADDLAATEPLLNVHGRIELRQARHPLLRGEVVPIDLQLGKDFDVLVLTGPNTGGKTVTLKTLGLLTLMAQAGLHVPAAAGSELAVFDAVFCDIGDEQSLEQSLSTFSSHMKNITRMLREISENSLVLLDELGAGTDPAEGSALGMAILEHLLRRKVKAVATTHYGELKSFAYTHERAQNASVEFDLETLRPTFRVQIGLPGRSNAFAIAERLGLDSGIVARARSLLGEEGVRVDDLIGRIEADRRAGEVRRFEAERLKREAAVLKEEYRQKLARLEETRENILAGAREEASSLIEQVEREAEEIVREMRRLAAEGAVPAHMGKAQDMLGELRQLGARVRAELVGEPRGEPLAPHDVTPGVEVYVPQLAATGVARGVPDAAGQVEVMVGAAKVIVPVSVLRRPAGQGKGAEVSPAGGVGRLLATKAQTVPPEIHLRGLTVGEMAVALDKYLDDAYLAGLASVRLIHGKGTGALRDAVRAFLEGHPHIASLRPGEPGEGGDGVTVAVFRRN